MCEGDAVKSESLPTSADGVPALAVIYVLGGTGSSEGMSQLMSVERFDITAGMDQAWKDGVKMRTPRLGACGAFAGGALYIVGGWNGNAHDCTMEKFEPATNKWSSSIGMRAPRTFSGMAALGNILYVCGGMTMQKSEDKDVQWNTSTVEYFDTTKTPPKWEGITSMQSPRLGPAVVAFGTQRIIALGGVDGDGTALSSVEILDVTQNAWTFIKPLPEARAAPGAVVHENTIYIFGGCGVDGVPLRSGFSLKLNEDGTCDQNQDWESMPPMGQARGGFGMVLAGSYIVAIGGSSVESQHLRTTEYINIADRAGGTFNWTNGPSMTHERRYPGVVVQTAN
jgi:N-acetylneuraminic acid mutarotase